MSDYYKRSSIQQSSETCLYVLFGFIFIGVIAVASCYTAEIINGANILIDMIRNK